MSASPVVSGLAVSNFCSRRLGRSDDCNDYRSSSVTYASFVPPPSHAHASIWRLFFRRCGVLSHAVRHEYGDCHRSCRSARRFPGPQLSSQPRAASACSTCGAARPKVTRGENNRRDTDQPASAYPFGAPNRKDRPLRSDDRRLQVPVGCANSRRERHRSERTEQTAARFEISFRQPCNGLT